jgi:F0F1-type ATP synthase membrane subunit c/vacuolar-type H+-ATPase subunit K
MTEAFPAAPAVAAPSAPIGKIRGTGVCIVLFIVTLGIYGLVYYFKTHEEMKQHSGQGLGGVVALILGFFVAFVLAFTMPGEVGNLRERAGQERRVSAVTGCWILLPFIGGIVWFVKTNGALNDYWRSQGAID